MDSLEKGKISSLQAFFLLFTLVVATAILFVPSITASEAGPDGWIGLLTIATVYGIVVLLIIVALANRFPGQTLAQYSEEILGKWLGKAVSLIYIFWFISVNSIILREFTDFINTAFMPETPIIVFILTSMLLGVSFVRHGIEVIARANSFISPLAFFAFAFITLGEINDFKLENLLPIMENGFATVVKGSLTPMAWRGEVILFAMLIPFLNKPKDASIVGITAIIGIGLLLSFANIITVGVLGVKMTANQVFPTFSLGTYTEIGGFVERLEAFIMLVWVTGVVIKIAIFYYVAVLATAQVFELRDYKPVVLPIGLLTAVWSIVFFENIVALKAFLSKMWPPYAFTLEFFIPLGLLLVAVLRKKGIQQKPKSPSKEGASNNE